MTPNLRIVPNTGRLIAATVANARLQAMMGCECHSSSIPRCPSLEPHARRNHLSQSERMVGVEAALPVGWVPESDGLETSGQGLESCIAFAAAFAILLTSMWVGYLGVGWVFEWVVG